MNSNLQENLPVLRFKDDQGDEYPAWEVKKLGDISTSFSGGTPTATNRAYYSGNIPFIKSGEITRSVTENCISEQALNSSSAKKVRIGDILYAIYGATSGEVAISKIDGAINQAVLCIRSSSDHRFLYQFLKSARQKIVATFIQGGQGNLSAGIVNSIRVCLPSFEEQKKIALFLSSVDTRIEQLEKKKSLFEQYKKGLMQKLFSQKFRFRDDQGKEFPEWEVILLKQVGETYGGLSGKSKDDFGDGKSMFNICKFLKIRE